MCEKFKNNNWKNHELCLSHYLSAPALNLDAMLNMTKVELKIIPDADMYLFFERGMRAGVLYIPKWYSKANNKYLKSYKLKK